MPATAFSDALGFVFAKLRWHLLGHLGMSLGCLALAMPAGSEMMLMPWPMNMCLQDMNMNSKHKTCHQLKGESRSTAISTLCQKTWANK